MDNNGSVVKPLFKKIQKGLVTIETLDDTFIKYHLTHSDSLRSLPLVVYESIYSTKFQPGTLVGKLDNNWVTGYFIPEYRIRNYDLLINKSYSLVTLGDLLILDNESIKELVSNRLIIIGDFTENDKVETPIGEISGPLLITNVLLSIENGDIIITIGFLVFILVSYFLISLLVYHLANQNMSLCHTNLILQKLNDLCIF